jgi:geranylgeranylglycerol-phosphate geranylgeranyltransferase
MAVGEPWNRIVWCFAWMAFFIDLGEEIAGDAMDIEGDKKRGSRSIAILRGRNIALALSGSFFGLVILLGLIPVVFGWLGTSYLLLILLTDILIILYTRRLLMSKTSEEGRKAMRGIYLGALFGLLASIMGQVIR